jgi:hypothetical protein
MGKKTKISLFPPGITKELAQRDKDRRDTKFAHIKKAAAVRQALKKRGQTPQASSTPR